MHFPYKTQHKAKPCSNMLLQVEENYLFPIYGNKYMQQIHQLIMSGTESSLPDFMQAKYKTFFFV